MHLYCTCTNLATPLTASSLINDCLCKKQMNKLEVTTKLQQNKLKEIENLEISKTSFTKTSAF